LKNNIVFLQARLDSKRLPGKVLLPINGIPMIDLQIGRISKSKKIEGIVVVIPDTTENDALHDHITKLQIEVHRGSLENVFDRFIMANKKFPSNSIIRLTADCPLVMPGLIDQMIEIFNEGEFDYFSNTLEETFPDGLDIEIFKVLALKKLLNFTLTVQEKEHVTLGLYSRPDVFSLGNFGSSEYLGDLRWTVDYQEDFDFVSKVFNFFKGKEFNFETKDVLEYLKEHPENHNKKSSTFRNIALRGNKQQ